MIVLTILIGFTNHVNVQFEVRILRDSEMELVHEKVDIFWRIIRQVKVALDLRPHA